MINRKVLSLYCELLTGNFLSQKIWVKYKIRAKFLFRSLFSPMTTLNYIRMLLDIPSLRKSVKHQPVLPTKIHRPYLFASLHTAERAAAICAHYRFVDGLNKPLLQQALLRQEHGELAQWFGKSDEHISLVSGISRYDKEGETTLFFYYNGTALATLTFSIIHYEGSPTIVIGGLQGKGNDKTREMIKHASKACFGLFPKRLLLECLLTLADLMKIDNILAVGDESHVYQHVRYRKRKCKVRFSSYSEFWLSLNATPHGPGLYKIPAVILRKDLEDLPSRKRAQYQRRNQLLDNLSYQIKHTLETVKTPVVVIAENEASFDMPQTDLAPRLHTTLG